MHNGTWSLPSALQHKTVHLFVYAWVSEGVVGYDDDGADNILTWTEKY